MALCGLNERVSDLDMLQQLAEDLRVAQTVSLEHKLALFTPALAGSIYG